MRLIVIITALVMLSGCTTTSSVVEARAAPRDIALKSASQFSKPPLNVSIAVFEDRENEGRTFASVRDAERRYLPGVLKRTLVQSGYWGVVRVVPEADPGAELTVVGAIVVSDGIDLTLDIKAYDATARVWLDKRYTDSARDHAYEDESAVLAEPFQDLFNEVANDLSEVYDQLDTASVTRVLDASMLRYAIDLSPQGFSQFLEQSETGQLVVTGLPARSDTMYQRVNRIRESEHRFIDAIDEQYEQVFTQVQTPYAFWRKYGYELIQYNRRIAAEGRKSKRKRPGYEGMKEVYQTYQDSRLNEDELRKLAKSFGNEITPTITRVAGQVVELNGSLENQYDEWRDLLRQIFAAERGLE